MPSLVTHLICNKEKEKLDKNVVDFEPHTALFVPDNNPLLFYEKIARFGRSHLNYNGKVYLETHEDYTKTWLRFLPKPTSRYWLKKTCLEKKRMVIATY